MKPVKASIKHYRVLIRDAMEEMLRKAKSSHDVYHHDRVTDLALHVHQVEGGDPLIIACAAQLHDIHRLMEVAGVATVPPRDSLSIVRSILLKIYFPSELIERVLSCVEFHEDYAKSKANGTPYDIETQILQDADRLDAIGAIGIGRVFTYGGAYDLPLWLPQLPFQEKDYDSTRRDPTSLHHIQNKLLKLGTNMHTQTAKKMAQERHRYMQEFFDRFLGEWRGEQ
jgi:uncharacterized protein